MPKDSDFSQLESRQRGRLMFDPTINAGHLLTFAGFMIAGFGAYTTLDKRVVIVEQKTGSIEQRASEQDARIKDSLNEIKQDLRDLKGSVNQIARNGQKAP